ncbi:Ig-like domain-containing protein [Pontibacterium sp.]|uniref:Ig-like domain-containing protein n=1 Tax=Pontibacterium sp. TaxID=2036026 RepID=UPI003564726F
MTSGDQFYPKVAALSDGGFVVVWHDSNSTTGDKSSFGINGQRFDAEGNQVGDEFLVNTHTNGIQLHPQVSGLIEGGFVVTWYGYGTIHQTGGDHSGYGMSGQVYDADGNKQGTEFLVNTHTIGDQRLGEVAALSDGGFIVVWHSHDNNNGDGAHAGISGQRYDVAGQRVGIEFLVNSNTSGGQFEPAVTALSSGGFVVTWYGHGTYSQAGGDHSGYGIAGQIYNADGDKLGNEFRVNTETGNDQRHPQVDAMSDGGFVISWDGSDYDTGDRSAAGVSTQRFDAEGHKVGGERLVNTETSEMQYLSDIATLGYSPIFDWHTNQTPDALDISASGTEDSSSITASFDGTDADGDTLSYSITSELPEGQGTIVNNNDGTFTFQPGDDFKSLTEDEIKDVTFTYTATDSAGYTSEEATATIAISGIDHTPEAAAAHGIGTEDDATITGTLTATDVDGGNLTFALAGAPAEGSVTVSENGDFSFVPGNDFKDLAEGSSRDVMFTYTATDGQGEVSEPATVTLTVTGIDHAPVVSSYSDTGTEDDASITGTLSATDVDGGDLIFALVDAPAEGGVIVNENGSFTFEPGSDFKDLMPDETRDVTFTYKATDEQGLDSVPATVTLTITGLEHAPVVTNVSFAGNEDDAAIDGQLTATDEEGDAVTFSVVEEPARGSVTVNEDGSFSFAPGDAFQYLNVGENETVSFTYAATDDTGRTGEPATVSITVEGSPEGFVAVWSSYRQDADNWGVFGQRYDEEGVAVGDEFQINTTADRSQSETAITSLNDGGFVVTWTSYQQDGSAGALMGQRYDADGIAQGSEFQVNTHTEGRQANAAISGLDNGGFVVSWVSQGQDGHGDGIYGQLFDAVGNAQGDEFLINSTTTFDQSAPSATSLSDGGFVMAWASQGQDGRGDGVFFQRFDAEGEKVGSESQANSHTFGNQTAPVADALSDGGFVIVWESDRQDGSDNGVFGQRFDADGQTVGDEFQINSTTQNNQSSPSVASLPIGGFVVTWASAGQDGDGYGVFAQRFDMDGNPDGDEFMVNSTVAYDQSEPKVAVQEDGSVIISWSSDRQDGSGEGIFAQRYDAEGNAIGGEFQMNTYTRYDQTDVAVTALRQEGDGTEVFNRTPTVEDVNLTLNEDDSSVAGSFAGTDVDGDAMSYTITSDLADGKGSITNNNDGTFTFTPGDDFQSLNDGESQDVTFTYTATDVQGSTSNPATATITVTGSDEAVTESGYVIVWNAQDSSGYGIFGQRYDVDDNPVGAEFQINTHSSDSQENPSITGLKDGGFVVTWHGGDSTTGDTDDYGIAGQRFAADGSAMGSEFLVNTNTDEQQLHPAITATADGGFVVTWYDYDGDSSGAGIKAQRFDAEGQAQGSELLVNTHQNGDQAHPDITGLSDGGFVVTWYGNDPATGDAVGISGQRFDADGNTVGEEFLINTLMDNAQWNPSVAGLSDGGFVVTWQNWNPASGDASGEGISGQRFDADGNAVDGEFLVNTHTSETQSSPVVMGLSDGGFVVVWHGFDSATGDESASGISGQRYDADGNRAGEEFLINAETYGNQELPAVTSLGDGGFVVTWQGADPVVTDGAGHGIAGQRFDANGDKVGVQFLVNPESDIGQFNSDIATLGYSPVFDMASAENQVPIAEDLSVLAVEDGASVTTGFDATDPDGDAMTYTIVSNLAAGEGSVTNNNDGTFTFTPGDDFQSLNEGDTQDVTFTYIATDDEGNVSGSATVTVTVQGADDAISPSDNIAPVVADISIVASEDYAVEGRFVGTDADLDNLTFELTSQPDQGSVTNNNDGSFSYLLENASELNTGETAETQFTYVANDGETNSETANVTIQLQGQSPSLDGGFVVAWSSYRQDGGDWGIYGQKYDAQGNTAGGEFLINTVTSNSQTEPAITSLPEGGFVVSWTSANEDGSGNGVFAQRYNTDGLADGDAIQVNSFTEGSQSSSALAATSNGGFVAVWNSANQDGGNEGIFGQRFDADGNVVGDEFQINSFTRWDQEDPAVTVLADDGYVVSWSSLAQDGRGYGIFGQQFDAVGNTVGDEFQINTYTRNSQTESAITALSDGGYVVTWESDNQDGSGRGIYGQRFDAAGQTQGNEFQINSETASNQINPVITDLNDGGFAVVWSSSDQDGSGNGVYGQRFDSDAQPVGDEFQINTATSRAQDDASIASLDDDGFVVTWSSDRQDGSGVGTFGQRFDGDGNTVGDEFQVNSYTQMHQENSVVTGLTVDHTLGAPDSFMHTSTVYANGDQTDLLQTDDDFVLGEIAVQFDSVDTLALSGSEGSEVVVDKNAVLAHTDTDNTLFITGDAGDSVHFTDEGWAEVAASDVDGLSTDWFSNGEVVVIVDQTLDVLSDFDILDVTV